MATTRTMASKVPEVTVFFWIIKVLSTTVGESAADTLNVDWNLGLTGTTVVMTAVLVVVAAVQFRADRYVPWIYWLLVVLVSVVGTLITDNGARSRRASTHAVGRRRAGQADPHHSSSLMTSTRRCRSRTGSL